MLVLTEYRNITWNIVTITNQDIDRAPKVQLLHAKSFIVNTSTIKAFTTITLLIDIAHEQVELQSLYIIGTLALAVVVNMQATNRIE